MFGPFGKNDMPELNKPIDRVLSEMDEHGPDAPEYPDLLSYLERLVALKRGNSNSSPSPDTLMTVAGNLLGILVIVAYEQKHVMSSKGLGFIGKPK
jgi:uncharacterized protein YehS (DUF1456 family)